MRLLLFISLFFSSVNAQEKIDYVKFDYNVSISPFSHVDITIIKPFPPDNYYDVIVKYYKFRNEVEKKSKINQEEFEKIVNQFLKIKNDDLIKGFELGLDGSNVSIKFGSGVLNTIEYNIWGLNKSQYNTTLKELLVTVQMIIKVADIKIEDFN